MVALQLIPILALVAYFFYLTYYYLVPMACFRVMKYYACKRHLCDDVRVVEEKVVLVFTAFGKEHKIERSLGVPSDSRCWTMTLFSTLKDLLKEAKKWTDTEQ